MSNRNITVDSLDKPNGPVVPMPENNSIRSYIKPPEIPWVVILLFASIPGLVVVALLSSLWWWSGHVLNDWNATRFDVVLALIYRAAVVVAPVVLLFLGPGLLLYRGYVAVQQAWVLRMQNNQPVDVRDITASRSNKLEARRMLMAQGLKAFYDVESQWAQASTFRNMNGAWSPTLQGVTAPAQLTDEPMLGIDTLPEEAGLDDVVIPPGHLGYGVGVDGSTITAPVGHAYHAVRQGDTGSGKTTNLNAELVQVHRIVAETPGQFELYAGDFKGEFEATWGQSPLFLGGIATQPEDIAAMLEDCMQSISTRYKLFVEAAQTHRTLIRNVAEYAKATGDRLPWKLVYLDEVNALLGGTIPKKTRERVDSSLKRGLQLGRGAGIFYECGAQYMTADLFDREGSKQFVTRAYFGAWDTTAMNMIFQGNVGSAWGEKWSYLLDGTPGRGIYAGLKAKPIPFQGLNVSVENIIDSIGSVLPGSSFGPGMPPESLEPAFSGIGSVSTIGGIQEVISGDPSSTHDVIAIIRTNSAIRTYYVNRIRTYRDQKVSKKEAIRQLFAATPGSSAGWKAASAFYDEAVGSP